MEMVKIKVNEQKVLKIDNFRKNLAKRLKNRHPSRCQFSKKMQKVKK